MHFKDIINNVFPELIINKIQEIGEGDTYVAFLVNGHYLFKQAKTNEGREQLKKEVLLMESLSGAFSISIPKFVLVSPDYHFGAYEILPGISFNEYLERNKFTISHAEQINMFITTLHSTTLAPDLFNLLPNINYLEEYKEDYEYLKSIPPNPFSKTQKKIILEKYESYLSCKNNFEFKPVLLHNDFSFNHIICDRTSGKITGVIDFGDAAIGDAAYDFFFLYDLPGSIFRDQVCNLYPQCNAQFIDRIQFYSFANMMQIIIGCHKENNNQLIMQEIKKVLAWFKTHLQDVDF